MPAERATGRISAETISPHPPGVPAIAPEEVLTNAVLDHLALRALPPAPPSSYVEITHGGEPA